ncbi:MAG: hypothetical protein AAB652_00630 [Patescibacteria group bacterium]
MRSILYSRRSGLTPLEKGKYSSLTGLTLIELVIFAAIFSVAAIIFVSILIAVTKVQVRQTAVAEIQQQSQFLLQTIQRNVETSSLIDMAANVTTSTLRLRMSSSAIDTLCISLDPNLKIVYVEAGTTPNYQCGQVGAVKRKLTEPTVNVESLSFIMRSNPPGHDSVSVSFTMSLASQNPEQKFSMGLQTGIARVGAATFDSAVYPPNLLGGTPLGSATALWSPINNSIYVLSNGNVGIGPGASNPGATLHVFGALKVNDGINEGIKGPVTVYDGLKLNKTGARPNCNNGIAGMLWYYSPGVGTPDEIQACLRETNGPNFFWIPL